MDTKTYNVNLKAKKTHWGGLTLNLSKNGKLLGGVNKPMDSEMALVLTNEKHLMDQFYYPYENLEYIPDEFILAPDLTTCQEMFAYGAKLKSINLSLFDTSNMTSIYWMFAWCESLLEVDVSSFNTSKVTQFDGVFMRCSALKSLDLTNWDTSNGEDFSNMFSQCYELEEIKGVIDITKANFSYSGLFGNCDKLKRIKIKATPDQQRYFRSTAKLSSNTEVIFV